MTLEAILNFPIQFTLVFFRLAGLMVFAPLIGSNRIPKRIKLYFTGVLALAMIGSMPAPVAMPASLWQLAAGLGGELLFGIALGTILSLVFVAAQFAGGVAGQQMGFNMAGNIDPRSDFGGDPLSDVYFILTLMLFLAMDGHHSMMLGIRRSFDYLPPLSVGIDREILDAVAGALMSATTLAVRVAAPVAVAMLVVDLALGMVGKTIPQMNLMSVGLSLRALSGLLVVIFGLGLTAIVLGDALTQAVDLAELIWISPQERAGGTNG